MFAKVKFLESYIITLIQVKEFAMVEIEKQLPAWQ